MRITEVLRKEIAVSKPVERLLFIVFFAFLTFASAMIRIPLGFTPVPLTLQTLVVFFAVYYVRPGETGISQSIYVFAGMIGAPVFAAGLAGGLAFVGPTAGYLAGFIVAGVLMSAVINKISKLTFVKALAVFAAGGVLILALGTIHLHLVYKMPLAAAIAAGFMPFMAVETAKALIAASFFKVKK